MSFVGLVVAIVSTCEVVLVNRKPLPSRDVRGVALVMMLIGFFINFIITFAIVHEWPFTIWAASIMAMIIFTWAAIVLMLLPYTRRRKIR
jgi:hypothetical protein